MTTIEHIPVLLRETLEILRPRAGGRYVDGTLGGGGHAEAILEASAPDGELLGVDWDEEARERSGRRLARFGPRLRVHGGAFDEIGDVLRDLGWEGADGILVDLGVSS
ncbi:MAG: 16S rRNA (cytosine(1402)-N(4))-methyltransferase, partial [Candidatus Binatia bacterium]